MFYFMLIFNIVLIYSFMFSRSDVLFHIFSCSWCPLAYTPLNLPHMHSKFVEVKWNEWWEYGVRHELQCSGNILRFTPHWRVLQRNGGQYRGGENSPLSRLWEEFHSAECSQNPSAHPRRGEAVSVLRVRKEFSSAESSPNTPARSYRRETVSVLGVWEGFYYQL